MEFRILGPLEVVDEGQPVALGGARQRSLLAILLTRANEVVSTDRLIDELWGEQPPRAAGNTVQYYVSQLRKALGTDRIVTRPPGYRIRVEPGELDLERFEALVESGGAAELREALRLWRGQALADFADETFAQPEITRLEELRLAALEKRIDADLARGRHAELVGELDALTAEHPLRERLRQQLMLALYRSGRQAEALAAYQSARRTLVEQLGLQPSPALQELELAILRHDSSLAPVPEDGAPRRSILVATREGQPPEALIALAESLARRPPREIVIVELVASKDELTAATSRVHERRTALVERGLSTRAAALTSREPDRDVVRLASQEAVDLVLLDGRENRTFGTLAGFAEAVLSEAPCDVAILMGSGVPRAGPDRPVLVPFGGADHEWAAVEVAAWIAGAEDAALELVGIADGKDGRDASALLATASLLVQRALGIPARPVLVEKGADAVVEAAADAGIVVVGLSPRWRREGLGVTRLAIARAARPPMLLVRRGPRPGGLAPDRSLTRFTWSLAQRDE
jgi:DNA-binding SARP family transcriptional activator